MRGEKRGERREEEKTPSLQNFSFSVRYEHHSDFPFVLSRVPPHCLRYNDNYHLERTTTDPSIPKDYISFKGMFSQPLLLSFSLSKFWCQQPPTFIPSTFTHFPCSSKFKHPLNFSFSLTQLHHITLENSVVDREELGLGTPRANIMKHFWKEQTTYNSSRYTFISYNLNLQI